MAETPDNESTVRLTISGRVQGVWFRVWLRDRALELGLCGWVRNSREGNVEALAVGSRNCVQRLIADCHEGPPLARVDRVVVDNTPVAAPTGFEIKPGY